MPDRTCRGGAQARVLYTMRSSAAASACAGEKHGSAFSPPSRTPAAAADSRTCAACTTHCQAAFTYRNIKPLRVWNICGHAPSMEPMG